MLHLFYFFVSLYPSYCYECSAIHLGRLGREHCLTQDLSFMGSQVLTSPKHALISDPFVNFAQSLTLRWINPKKNKKWLQLHMSAAVSTRGWGVSAWSGIIQMSCICISVIAIRMYSPSQQEWWHADSPREATFPVVKLACWPSPPPSLGSPVGLTGTCAVQLTWLVTW